MFLVVKCLGLSKLVALGFTQTALNVKLCLMVLLIELYLFIPLSVTLTIFQGHKSVKQFQLKILRSLPIK